MMMEMVELVLILITSDDHMDLHGLELTMRNEETLTSIYGYTKFPRRWYNAQSSAESKYIDFNEVK
jgi:hypothetical protein